MIFYIARDDQDRRHLVGTQADARAINKDFEQIDIPTDKAGLMKFVQDLYTQLDLQGDGVNMGIATGLEMAGLEPVAQKQDMRIRMGQCPSCARTPVAAQWAAENANVADVVKVIETAPKWGLVDIYAAFLDRSAKEITDAVDA